MSILLCLQIKTHQLNNNTWPRLQNKNFQYCISII